jgi:CRP-like cAMP-binding protein
MHDDASEPLHRNRLLAALPGDEHQLLAPHLSRVRLHFKQTLYERDRPIDFVYFLERGVASLITQMDDGTKIEVGTVGPEGVVGLPIFLDASSMSGTAFVQVPGEGCRVEAKAFRQLLDRMPRLRQLLSRYTLALFTQLAQNSACNRTHAVEQRLARWLLLTNDRVHQPSFPLTQEFMADMLGTSRPTVSIAAGMLQKAGLISYVRGNMTVMDREGLEAASCECYGVIKTQFERLVGGDG